jgi:hypothetical protein
MLRRLLRFSFHASNKFSPIFRQKTIVAPLSPSLCICLGVSVATFATIITIHGDAKEPQAADHQPEKLDSSVQKRTSLLNNYLLRPQSISPSPTTDETFDSSSDSSIPKDEATGIGRIDTILLARYVQRTVVCPLDILSRIPFLFQSIATTPAKTTSITSQLNSLVHSTTICLEFTMDTTDTS